MIDDGLGQFIDVNDWSEKDYNWELTTTVGDDTVYVRWTEERRLTTKAKFFWRMRLLCLARSD
jgi:hypothetical protein